MKVIQTKYGRGIESTESYSKGDLITISEGIPLNNRQMPLQKSGSPIWAYIFDGLHPGKYILVLDWTSLMNHNSDANVGYFPISNTQIKYIALKNIEVGDELNINYGYDIEEHSKMFRIDEEKLVNDTQLFDSASNLSPSSSGVDLIKLYSDCIEKDIEGNWRIISNKTGEYWKQKYDSEDSAKAALRAYHARKVGNFDSLIELRKQLFDAPANIKESFNKLISYLSNQCS